MLDILQVVVFGVVVSIIIMFIKNVAPEYAPIIRIVGGILILIPIVLQLKGVFDIIISLAQRINMNDIYLKIVFKVVGISYLTELGASLLRDAQEEALAKQIEFAGKVMIFIISIPVILALIELIEKVI